jgi:hypothetical protein
LDFAAILAIGADYTTAGAFGPDVDSLGQADLNKHDLAPQAPEECGTATDEAMPAKQQLLAPPGFGGVEDPGGPSFGFAEMPSAAIARRHLDRRIVAQALQLAGGVVGLNEQIAAAWRRQHRSMDGPAVLSVRNQIHQRRLREPDRNRHYGHHKKLLFHKTGCVAKSIGRTDCLVK